MPKVDNSAREPLNPKSSSPPSPSASASDLPSNNLVLLNKPSGSSLEHYLFTIFILLAVILASIYLRIPHSKAPLFEPEPSELKTVYSGVSVNEGEIYFLNRHEARRRRSASRSAKHEGVRGLALDCGNSCYFRLRQNASRPKEAELRIHLFRWRQLPVPHNKSLRAFENNRIRPIVQFLDTNDTMHARLSRVAPDCIYSAHVNGALESSIVNLCDTHGGLFGTLALPDGTYLIEPVESRHATSSGLSRKAHLVYKSRSHSFHSYDYSVSNSSAISRDESLYKNVTNLNGTNPVFVQPDDFVDINVRNTRSRRSANSWDHYVEVLVVADYKMLLYHQDNLENYILTLFSTVASIYRHPSLKAAVNIIVVKILILKQELPEIQETSTARNTLIAFCKWQKYFNDPNEESPSHYDVAILLTRNDICRAPGKCDTLGLAELGTMCKYEQSCAIIEDNGLSAGFTITHELGHIFNIPHDDEDKCSHYMLRDPQNYHIMAPTLEYNTHPWSWSPCSSAMLGEFLDVKRSQTQCLLDQPIERRYYDRMFEIPAPGAMFSADQQCQLVFGSHARLCPFMPACKRLWCEVYVGYQRGCRTQHMPWADGTPCGSNEWCHRGECVGLAPQQRPKQDGGWGEWRQWGECSRTCGGGVQKAVRDCDNPRPSHGGKYCVGQRERYRSCNILDCPLDTPGFREVQCSAFDYRDVGIFGVPRNARWVPRYEGVSENERCKLYCRVNGLSAFYLIKDKVTDGTPCDRDSDDICIDGTCHKAGCDHRIGSDVRRDKCGVCGGDSTSCRMVSGVYNERGQYGYTEVIKIPAGASNIEITQRAFNNQREDDNYLALRNANNEFILNGNYQVSVFPMQVPVQKAILWYSGSDHVVERVNGTGPIWTDIYLHVLSVGRLHPPDIHYQYMMPLDINRSHQRTTVDNYYWKIGDTWSQCSASCQGQQTQTLICVDSVSGRNVAKEQCKSRPPTLQTRMCNIECVIKWRAVVVGACSVTCGHGEQRQRSECIRQFNDGREEAVAESECRNLNRPSERVSCYLGCTGRNWQYSEWSQCSETCGTKGVSQRRAFCVDQDNNRPVDEKFCERSAKELTEKECNRVPCPKWIYSSWSECSRSCDGGVRVRHASCQDAAGREVDARMCSASEKHDREACNEHLCTQWRFGSWSSCSVTCGEGVQNREATCVDREGRQLDPGRCNPRHRHVQKQCRRAACPTWRLGSWSGCSATCLEGWISRSVLCVDSKGAQVDESLCLAKGETRPPSHQACNFGPCPFWRTSDWSQCSVSCGSGLRSRKVECVYRDQVVDGSLCSEQKKPTPEEQCHLYACAHWEPSAWGPCSVSCGRGQQQRAVKCIRDSRNNVRSVVHEKECDQATRPKTERVCEKDACETFLRNTVESSRERARIRWETGSWTECSRTCGQGIQRRLVKCRYDDRDVADEYCKKLNLPAPASTIPCRIKPCVKWVVGPWKPCPATCGSQVVSERRVTCESTDAADIVKESDCEAATKPQSSRSCGLPACPVPRAQSAGRTHIGGWITGAWEQCSTTCGPGWRRRTVTCNARPCSENTKPPQFEQCNLRDCSKSYSLASWRSSSWSRCPVTCGGGVQRRDVWCEDNRTRIRLSEADCHSSPKPVTARDCGTERCRNASGVAGQYHWRSGKWTPCSKTCGRGMRVRQVFCADLDGAKVDSEFCAGRLQPNNTDSCRIAHCPKWKRGKWSMCSTTCGKGVKTRKVFCMEGRRTSLPDSNCADVQKPSETASCEVTACPDYRWFSTKWSKCKNPCKKELQRREVYCISSLSKRAAERMCNRLKKPEAERNCPTAKCPYHWVPGPWTSCTTTCGEGFHYRSIKCRIKNTDQAAQNIIEAEATVHQDLCLGLPKPPIRKQCAIKPCDFKYRWMTGQWSNCSKKCGPGYRRRKVTCVDKDGEDVDNSLCDQGQAKPRKKESCFVRNCIPSDCADLKMQNRGITDGLYTILVDGFMVRVFCYRMNETVPKTYIEVNSSTNYAEFYGKRLNEPYTCPHNGRRNDSCACHEDTSGNAGFTVYAKIRVDLHNMRINIDDDTFANTTKGVKISYATAGDCYSTAKCPQGRFEIDLRGTGLRIADNVGWGSKGQHAFKEIHKSSNNARVIGRCGGYCSRCVPNIPDGLLIEVDRRRIYRGRG